MSTECMLMLEKNLIMVFVMGRHYVLRGGKSGYEYLRFIPPDPSHADQDPAVSNKDVSDCAWTQRRLTCTPRH